MMRVLLIGNGGREHVIAETLARSRDTTIVTYGSSKNPGISALSEGYEIGKLDDLAHIREYALKTKPAFALCGPENPIAAGVSDMLLQLSIHTVAPLQSVARLESSKGFARDLLQKYNIPGNPKFKVFYSQEGLLEFLESLGEHFVVKADGLMGGKGVKVSGDHLNNTEDALAYAHECLAAHNRVVVEEKMHGPEFSLMSFVDGTHVLDMPPVQDHKRAFPDDKGPNTGGMGSYSNANHLLPFLEQKHLDAAHTINEKVVTALFQETGVQYKGIIYGGFMLTKNGVCLIEYNVRFGDPEVMNVLPLLETDFTDVCQAIIAGKLHEFSLSFARKATVCKYVVPEGYPESPKKGVPISVGTPPKNARLYYASVDERKDSLYLAGSRAIACVGIDNTLAEAEKIAEAATNVVQGPVFHRSDIGTKTLIQKRIDAVRKFSNQ